MTRDVLAAASVLGLKVHLLKAGTNTDIDAAFASLDETQTRALLVPHGAGQFPSRVSERIVRGARLARARRKTR